MEDIPTNTNIERADACIIALGASAPHLDNLQQWHSVEIDLIRTIAEFCNKIQVQYISLLSAVDVEHESVVPFTQEDIASYGEGALGWIKMIQLYNRMKGLEERAVIESASDVPYIRLFQPNTIVTEKPRYGWFDTTLFALQGCRSAYSCKVSFSRCLFTGSSNGSRFHKKLKGRGGRRRSWITSFCKANL